jgi:hypothetical protein
MSDERKQILRMLADGKISADEAERLLSALDIETGAEPQVTSTEKSGKHKPKFLCVKVQCEPGSHHRHDNVDVKIPIVLLKAGVKLGSLVPEESRNRFSSHLAEKGLDIDLNKLDGAKLDEFVQALCDSSIDIDTDKEKVRIFCC